MPRPLEPCAIPAPAIHQTGGQLCGWQAAPVVISRLTCAFRRTAVRRSGTCPAQDSNLRTAGTTRGDRSFRPAPRVSARQESAFPLLDAPGGVRGSGPGSRRALERVHHALGPGIEPTMGGGGSLTESQGKLDGSGLSGVERLPATRAINDGGSTSPTEIVTLSR